MSLDAAAVAAELDCERDRVVRALGYLHDKKMLEVKAAGVRYRYRRMRVPDNLEAIAENLCERMAAREERDIGRLQQVLEWACHDGCRTSALGGHFGEPLENPCGHCGWCLGDRQPLHLRGCRAADIDDSLWREIEQVRSEHSEVLGDARALARWLCGVGSPRLRRAKLTRHELYGALAHLPFEDLLKRAAE